MRGACSDCPRISARIFPALVREAQMRQSMLALEPALIADVGRMTTTGVVAVAAAVEAAATSSMGQWCRGIGHHCTSCPG